VRRRFRRAARRPAHHFEQFADAFGRKRADAGAAAVKQAEALVALQLRKAVSGSFRRPAAKATAGLAPRLTARIEHR
jgi:hypothetical protein